MPPARPSSPEQLQVLNVEEQFRLTRLRTDVKALDRLLSEGYGGTNQNGKTRTKADVLELYKQFKTKSLVTTKPEIMIHGDTAVVSGFQTEVYIDSTTGPSQPARFRFVRVYVKGEWPHAPACL